MWRRSLAALVLVSFLSLGAVRPAAAQWAVIDVAAIQQLVTEVQTLSQQLATAQSQLSQAQSEFASITGNRGMQLLLSGTVRNYLPTDVTTLTQVMSGSSGSYPALAAAVTSLVGSNAILTPAQVASFSPVEQAQLAAARQSPALLSALAQAALSNSSSRFTALQTLITALGGASDQKAVLDLNTRVAAEQGMLQNEATKLQVLYQLAQSQEWARVQRVREQAIAGQGSLRTLSPMGL
ncbi:MAG TPA: type IV secretion system protein [Stellaceae bacterium]|nr:type IV secretion system protein [Stellaceae bacterium]